MVVDNTLKTNQNSVVLNEIERSIEAAVQKKAAEIAKNGRQSNLRLIEEAIRVTPIEVTKTKGNLVNLMV